MIFKNIYHCNESLQRQEISCMKNPNWLLRLLPGRAIIARVEGEMTRLDIFSGSIMLLYGMDGNPNWDNRHCRFLGEVYAGEELEGEYSVSDKKEGNSES
jgi:hypothetical protein